MKTAKLVRKKTNVFNNNKQVTKHVNDTILVPTQRDNHTQCKTLRLSAICGFSLLFFSFFFFNRHILYSFLKGKKRGLLTRSWHFQINGSGKNSEYPHCPEERLYLVEIWMYMEKRVRSRKYFNKYEIWAFSSINFFKKEFNIACKNLNVG